MGSSPAYANGAPKKQTLKTTLWSPGLSRLVTTAMLAKRGSSTDSISQLCVKTGACEKVGAEVSEGPKAFDMHTRIVSKFLGASVGFASVLVDIYASGVLVDG